MVTRLLADLDGFDGALARVCKAVALTRVTVEGWEDLVPVLAEWEGPAVTTMTLGLTNGPDLVFAAEEAAPEPELLLGLYSDEAYPFSVAPAEALLDDCRSDAPAWLGQEEDVEVYCALSGLAPLNAALIHHKHRHFLRDGRDGVDGRAPGAYVEYVLGCWLRSALFLQAVQRSASSGGVPDGVRLVVGAVEVNADFLCLVEPRRKRTSRLEGLPVPVATLTMKPWAPRDEPSAAAPAGGSGLRRRLLAELEPDTRPPPQPARRRLGWLARLFGFARR